MDVAIFSDKQRAACVERETVCSSARIAWRGVDFGVRDAWFRVTRTTPFTALRYIFVCSLPGACSYFICLEVEWAVFWKVHTSKAQSTCSIRPLRPTMSLPGPWPSGFHYTRYNWRPSPICQLLRLSLQCLSPSSDSVTSRRVVSGNFQSASNSIHLSATWHLSRAHTTREDNAVWFLSHITSPIW